MLLLGIWLILIGLSGFFDFGLASIVVFLLAIAAGVLILFER